MEGVLEEGVDALLPCALLGTSVGRVFDGVLLGAWGDQVAVPLCVLEEPLILWDSSVGKVRGGLDF